MTNNPTTDRAAKHLRTIADVIMAEAIHDEHRDERENGIIEFIDGHIARHLDETTVIWKSLPEAVNIEDEVGCDNPACSDLVHVSDRWMSLIDDFDECYDLCTECFEVLSRVLTDDEGPTVNPCLGCGAEWYTSTRPAGKHMELKHRLGCLEAARLTGELIYDEETA